MQSTSYQLPIFMQNILMVAGGFWGPNVSTQHTNAMASTAKAAPATLAYVPQVFQCALHVMLSMLLSVLWLINCSCNFCFGNFLDVSILVVEFFAVNLLRSTVSFLHDWKPKKFCNKQA